MTPENVLLDSCILLDVFQTKSDFHTQALALMRSLEGNRARRIINDLVVAEIVPFFATRVKLESALSDLGVVVEMHTLDDAYCAGGMRADLKGELRMQRGQPQGRRFLIDLIIAAHARRVGALATRDTDFEPVEKIYKLKVYWAT